MSIDPSDLLYAAPSTILRAGRNDAVAVLSTGRIEYLGSQEMAVRREALECRLAGRLVGNLLQSGTFLTSADAYMTVERLIAADVLHRVVPASLPRNDGRPLDTIGIPTADRPALLSRCLQTLDSYCQLVGRTVFVIIVDGSRDASNAAHNRAAARLANLSNRMEVVYVGAMEAQGLCQGLLRSGFSDSTWTRTLRPGQFGANRNLLLLLTAGRRLLMCDDDICWDTWSSRSTDEPAFWAHHRDASTQLFRSREAARLVAAACPKGDLLAEHGALLGQPIGALASTAAALDGMCSHLAGSLANSGTSILATFSGIAGDSARRCPYSWLLTDNPLRRKMLADSEICSVVLSSREVLRQVNQPSVVHGGPVMAYCTAFANTEPLVPFAPIGRNEDGVFGCLMMATKPRVAYAYVPCGIVHDSPRQSAYEWHEIPSAGPPRVSDIFISAIERFATWGNGIDGLTLRSCGLAFRDFADHDPVDRAGAILRDVWSDRLKTAVKAEAEMRKEFNPLPDHIQRALDRYRAALCKTAMQHHEVAPIELGGTANPVHTANEISSWLRAYGDLMAGWPEIWATAKNMQFAGVLAASQRAPN